MDTVIEKGTVVTASCMTEAMGAEGHYVFAGGLDTTGHLPGEKDVGTETGAPAAQSTLPWQED
jgi:formylmethanofuran dehydrogenase subunit A